MKAPPWAGAHASSPAIPDRKRSPPNDATEPTKRVKTGDQTDSLRPKEPYAPTSWAQGLSSRFAIQPLDRFQGAAANIERPRELAHFSYDDSHEYREDESGINYYCPPQLGSDLRDGFDTFRHYEDTTDPHL